MEDFRGGWRGRLVTMESLCAAFLGPGREDASQNRRHQGAWVRAGAHLSLRLASGRLSDDFKVFGGGFWHGRKRDVLIECQKTALVFSREAEQVKIGEMF